MKKSIVLILLFSLILGMMTVFANETDEMPKAAVNPLFERAKTLVDIVGEGDIFTQEAITRGEFVFVLAKFFKIGEDTPEEYFYSDVKSFTTNASIIYGAYRAGWISKADKFLPNINITYGEAVKIALNALGYNLLAESSGGYPVGYDIVEKNIGLLSDVNISSLEITKENAYILLYNVLNTGLFEQKTYGIREEYKQNGITVLNKIYDIYKIKGIVSSTAYNSLNGGVSTETEDTIGINGVIYKYENSRYDMLGTAYIAFVKMDSNSYEKEVICMFDDSSEKTYVDLKVLTGKQGQRISYENENSNRDSYVTLDLDCEVIYNGRKVSESIDGYFTAGTGNILFVDNSGDGLIDTVFIKHYSYMQISTMDTLNLVMRDKNAPDFKVDLSESTYVIYDENGEKLDIFDISADDIFQILKSEDAKFVEAIRLNNSLSGSVTCIGDDYVTIDETEYYMSDYFKAAFLKNISTRTEGLFMVTNDMVVITLSEYSDQLKYGYLVNAKIKSGADNTLQFKIFSENGNMELLNLQKKITLDGISVSSNDDIYRAVSEGGTLKPQLIKYGLSSEGKIKTLDVESTTLPSNFGEAKNQNDSLIRYSFPSASFLYKSNTGCFSSFFNVLNSKVFCIPSDITDDEGFDISNRSVFWHDTTYTVTAYDLDKTGGAAAVVYLNSSASKVWGERNPGIIEKVARSINENGEHGYALYLWNSNSYLSTFMKENILVQKSALKGEVIDSSHPLLSSGDIVVYETDESGEITAIVVEFDARKGVFAPNASPSSGKFNITVNTTPMYHEGMIYSYDGKFIGISNTYSGSGKYNFSLENIRFLSAGSNIILIYDSERRITRPGTPDEVRTYLTDGDSAHYAVICQRAFVTNTIVLYERTEGRR